MDRPTYRQTDSKTDTQTDEQTDSKTDDTNVLSLSFSHVLILPNCKVLIFKTIVFSVPTHTNERNKHLNIS